MLFDVIRSLLAGRPVDLVSVLVQVLAVLFVIFCILPLHECAHGWMASKLGDDTARVNGRITLNPLASIDPFGALCILLFGFGWAKAVPVNPHNFRNPKRDMALTALAGPVSNLLAALAGALLQNVLFVIPGIPNGLLLWISVFFSYYISINVMLAVFNLIPLPPLDGSRVLGAFLSYRALQAYYRYQQYIMIGLVVLLFSGLLDYPLSFLANAVSDGIYWLASLPFWAFW